jgi:hypothetical protein
LVHDEVEYCTGFHASVVPFHFLGSNIFIARLKFSTCYGMCLKSELGRAEDIVRIFILSDACKSTNVYRYAVIFYHLQTTSCNVIHMKFW